MSRIALVDDDRNILTSVSMTLEAEGFEVDTYNDHRIAMSFAVAALRASGTIHINDCDHVATSFPGFAELAASVGLKVSVES